MHRILYLLIVPYILVAQDLVNTTEAASVPSTPSTQAPTFSDDSLDNKTQPISVPDTTTKTSYSPSQQELLLQLSTQIEQLSQQVALLSSPNESAIISTDTINAADSTNAVPEQPLLPHRKYKGLLPSTSNETIQKGRGYVGLLFSFSKADGENYKVLGVLPVAQKEHASFHVSLIGGYLFKDRFSVGTGLAYTYHTSEQKVNDTLDISIIESGYAIVPHIRNYVPLPKKMIFQVYNQTNLGFSYITSLQEDDNGSSLDRWNTDAFEFELGIQPGVSVMAGKGVTIEAGIDVLGLKVNHTKIYKNGDFYGYHDTADLSFKLNLLSLILGITVYL